MISRVIDASLRKVDHKLCVSSQIIPHIFKNTLNRKYQYTTLS